MAVCDGTFAAFNSSVGSDNSYQMYRSITANSVTSARALVEQGRTFPAAEAAQIVSFLIVTDLLDIANVHDADYEADFRRGVAMGKSYQNPASVPAVEKCVEMVREMAPAFATSNYAATLLKLYPAGGATTR